jgi:hypothetical protein
MHRNPTQKSLGRMSYHRDDVKLWWDENGRKELTENFTGNDFSHLIIQHFAKEKIKSNLWLKQLKYLLNILKITMYIN